MTTVHPKATGGAAGGSVGGWFAIIFLWLLATYLNVHPPTEVLEAITGIFTVAAGFVGAYLASSPWVSPALQDVPLPPAAPAPVVLPAPPQPVPPTNV